MPLTAGTVTISDAGVETGADTTTLAGSIYLQLKALQETDFGTPIPIGAEGVPIRRSLARQSNRLASAFVTYFTNNAAVAVSVKTTDSGLQRHPASDVENTDCNGPATDKELTGTIS